MRRFRRTLSILSGAKRAVASAGPDGLQADAPTRRLGADPREAALHDRGDRQLSQLERQRARLDPAELEEVVDELGEDAHLVAERGEVVRGLRETVLERFEHRLHVRERRAEIVAGPGDELSAGVEDPCQRVAHLVEVARERRDLRRAVLRSAGGEVASRELGCRPREPLDRPLDRPRDHERGHERDGGRCGADGEDLHVVAHVEHHPSGREHDDEGEADREDGEPDEPQAQRRQRAQRERDREADGERRERDDEPGLDHGTSR